MSRTCEPFITTTHLEQIARYTSMAATLKRFKHGQSRPDLFSYFVQEDGQLHPDMTMKDLDAEVRAMIIAGEFLLVDHLTCK